MPRFLLTLYHDIDNIISVLERTKEIVILRSVGASKRDISRVFNAETTIVGLTAGLIGIGTFKHYNNST